MTRVVFFLFLLPLVLARWAEVKAMIVAPVRCLRQAERCWKPTTLFHSRIHWKISLPSCFRPELGLSVARHLQRSPVREVGKQETTACTSRVGGMVSIYLTNVCSLALVSQGKGTMIGVTLDSPSDSWVPTHGATSVPSMPAFSGNPILPTRSRQDILENPKAPTFQHETRLEIVAPDQVQIWWRQSLRHKENIDINFAAEFATH